MRVPGVYAQARQDAVHEKPPPRSAVDREVQRPRRAERTFQLAHRRPHIADVVDAILDDREIVVPALAGERFGWSLAVFHRRVA